MRLVLGAVLTLAIGWGVVLAAPKPARRHASKAAVRRANAEQLCKAQGANCRLVVRPDAPRDLTGAGCVCDAEPARD
jgi:nucleotidyltransferase/DNA polymerase involved in DNA repair